MNLFFRLSGIPGSVNLILVLLLVFGSNFLLAQPSGGPHGPIHKTYELPDVSGKIYYVAPDGNPDVSGEEISNPTTLKAVVKKCMTGDAIILRNGVYRTGELVFNQGLTFQPYKDEQPVLKGTFIADNWEKVGETLWKTKWDYLFPADPEDWWRREREEQFTPLHRFNDDMVFVDGRFLQSAANTGELNDNTFYIDYDKNEVYLAINPESKLIEITAFSGAIHRVYYDVNGKSNDGIGPVIRGIDFTQYSDTTIIVECVDPVGKKDESEIGKEVRGTVIENCDISYCSRQAAFLMGDNTVMRSCKVSNTSREGIYVVGSADVLLEKNIIEKNNIENITGCYPAGVKIFNQNYRCTCRDNLVTNMPNSNGIWYDVGNVDGRFINNWIENVGGIDPVATNRVWPSQNGFFFEISKGAVCAGNVFVNCDHGLLALNSSNVEIYQNTFVNSMVCIARDTRSAQGDHFGWHPSTGPDVDERFGHVFVNNLLVGDENMENPLLLVWQPAVLCERLNESPLKQFDHNVFIQSTESNYNTLAFWSPFQNEQCQIEVNSLDKLKDVSGDNANSLFYTENHMPLFKSTILKNFVVVKDFEGNRAATQLPEKVKKLIGLSNGNGNFVGAYPVK
ncbi:MAG: right-handed parallel beta-helix repeat-containing protein [Prolixibacteraceae bacterium]|nr:right-handed parallel beta-helix repeat-containing protein [Prolixibacteraceae bacterium]MBN2775119.1 right-handed parallel beta-helix repeat-containing protein [Prolixibacteraceae bacterium]